MLAVVGVEEADGGGDGDGVGAARGEPAGADVEIVEFGVGGVVGGDAVDPDALGFDEGGVEGGDFCAGGFADVAVGEVDVVGGGEEEAGVSGRLREDTVGGVGAVVFDEDLGAGGADGVGAGGGDAGGAKAANVDDKGFVGEDVSVGVELGAVAVVVVVEEAGGGVFWGGDELVREFLPEGGVNLLGGGEVLFGDVSFVDETKSFGLGVDFLAGHGDF